MSHPPIFSREALVQRIAKLESLESSYLNALGILTAGFSGMGFIRQFETPTTETFALGIAMGFGVFIIARMMWAGAAILPEFVRGNLILPYIIIATLAFAGFGTVSFFGNQRIIAGAVSADLADQDATNDLANIGLEISSHTRQLGLVFTDLKAHQKQAQSAAKTELSGTGPTGTSGRGPVYRSFVAMDGIYGSSAAQISEKLAQAEALIAQLQPLLDQMGQAQQDQALSRAERRQRLGQIGGRARSLLAQLLALDPAGAVSAVATKIAQGVPPQSGAKATSEARIADINALMRDHAKELVALAKRLEAARPTPPQAKSQSQEEHLMANILRMPGLSLAALLFDACGWIIISFRMIACQALRQRDATEEASQYDEYITLDDLRRMERMVRRVTDAQSKIEGARPMKDITPQNGGQDDV